MYIFSMYSGYLYKNDCRSAKTQEREEVKLEYPGMTDRHRSIQHHVYSDLQAGRCVLRDRIHFSAINPKPQTLPGAPCRAGRSSFLCPGSDSTLHVSDAKLGHPDGVGRPQIACLQGSSALGKSLK